MIKRKDFNSYKEYLTAILDHRANSLRRRTERFIARARKFVDSDTLEEDFDKMWLEQFVTGSNGIDVCCGDFPLAPGIDNRLTSVGWDTLCEGDNLNFVKSNELDFIVTNWFDVFPAPLIVLKEWHRCLKEGGVLAFVCRDALVYNDTRLTGPLDSRHRTSVFCKKTLSMYLYKAGFKEVVIEECAETKALRAKAIK